MIEKIFERIRFHFRRNQYMYHHWLKNCGRFILLWIKVGIIVTLILCVSWHANRINNGQGTDADIIGLIIEIITLITIVAWYACDDDDDF